MAYHISVFLENNPGKLEKITTILSDNNINLRAILSRPDKSMMGKYNFFIEFNLNKSQKNDFNNLIKKYNEGKDFKIKILGIYGEI